MDSTYRAQSLSRAGALFARGDHWLARLIAYAPDRIVEALDARLLKGQLLVTFPEGGRRLIGGKQPGPSASVSLRNWRALRRLVLGGHAAWATAFIDGDWDSPDLTALFHLFSVNRSALGQTTFGNPLVRRFNHWLHSARHNSKEGSRKNISFHYDLGNDFYALWLDETMSYSSAIFESADEDFATAQTRKYRRLLDLLGVKPGDHVCEIGCGWGGLAEVAARDYGAHVTGVTLSAEQLAFAQARMEHLGLSRQVDLRLQDYRDLDGRFDHIVSIEMFEAVGEAYWPVYMDKVKSLLRPGGKAALQIITIDDASFENYRRGADFIQTYIFPGGMLPSLARLKEVSAQHDLKWIGNKGFGLDYAETLRRWRVSFEHAIQQQRLPKGFDERFQRIWRYYLTYCEGGFRGKAIDVHQILLGV